jgi:hypothetical protein
MKSNATQIKLASALLALWLLMLSCARLGATSVGELQTETQSVDLGSAQTALVQIQMAAGEMKVGGGADSLMQATFRYNVDDWKPQVDYSVNGSQGELRVDQKDRDVNTIGSDVVNEWDIQLNNAVPISLDVQTGAGESVLDLKSLDLTDVKFQAGAGTADIDLSGNWSHDVQASVVGGVGKLTVMLPSGIGVQVTPKTGIGGMNTTGLVQEGEVYVNEAFGESPYTLFLNIQAGVGELNLEVR